MLFELDKQWVIKVKISLTGIQTEMAKSEWEHYGLETSHFIQSPVQRKFSAQKNELFSGEQAHVICALQSFGWV